MTKAATVTVQRGTKGNLFTWEDISLAHLILILEQLPSQHYPNSRKLKRLL